MTDKPTGVFVRLPLSDTEKMALTSGVKMGGDIEAGISAIGTPVTGGELEVVGYADPADFPLGENWSYEILGAPRKEFMVSLVRQSDALAKLAEKDAEIARLNEELQVFRAGLSDLVAKEVAALKGPEA